MHMDVEIAGLGFSYPSSGSVLVGLNLSVASGSIHGIVGANGCGKTTLLRIIAGAEQPTEGSIRLVGERRHANRTAMVFQTPRLLPWWTVERNIGIGLEFAGTPPTTYERIRDFFTAHVGLSDLKGRLPASLSGGQQSRTGLGRALAHDADVLLMDEPFAHLDAPARHKLHHEIEAFWMMSTRTVVLVTHDIEEAVMLADRVSVMRRNPGPIVDTIEVDAGRPRRDLTPAHPGIRSATQAVWEALKSS